MGGASSHDISATLKNSYALSFKGGYVLNPDNLIYIKMGMISSRWNIASSYPYFVPEPSINATYKTTKRQFGLLLGTGIEMPLNNKFIAGAEVTYAKYKKISYSHPHMNKSSISPSAFSFNLKLSYKI